MKLHTRQLTCAAIVGAAYAVLSIFGSIFGITYGPIQCRFSEALCVLPFLLPETAWGLGVGCLIANLLSPYGILDIVVGSAATLLAALLTARCKKKWLAPLPPVVQCSDLQIRWIHAAAAQWALQNWDSAIQCQILLLQLYRSLLQTAPSGGQPPDPIAAHAAELIHRRFKTAFSIDALAQECAVSPSYLRARFRQSMGCSILEYRDRLRINAAREMLQSGFFSVGEVAAALGYCDVYHFSRVFTAHVHCPPGKFRRTAR